MSHPLLSLLLITTIMAGISSKAHEIPLVRLDSMLSAAHDDSIAIKSLTDSLRPAVITMSRIGITANDSWQGLHEYAQSRAFTFFEPEVKARLDSIPFSTGITATINRLDSLLPGILIPRHIYGIITPYNQTVMNVDSIMLIGMNHYLGHDYEAYKYFEPYIRRQKEARLLPYHVAESLIQQSFPMTPDSSATALTHMLHDGAVTAATMASVPGASLACAGGWTAEELSWLQTHEEELWKEMVDRKMLESTDRRLITNLLAPSPATIMFGNHAPGRTGRYIGYRLIQTYIDRHPDIQLSSLLSHDFMRQHHREIINEYTDNNKSR